MNGQFFCETSDECVPCSGVVKLRAEIGAREAALVRAHERWVEQDAEIERLTTENERLRKLCPSLVDLDTNEALTPDSTITVAVGYLHTLLEKDAEIAKLKLSQSEMYGSGKRLEGELRQRAQDAEAELAASCAENAALAKLVDEWIEIYRKIGDGMPILCDDVVRRCVALRAGQQKGTER